MHLDRVPALCLALAFVRERVFGCDLVGGESGLEEGEGEEGEGGEREGEAHCVCGTLWEGRGGV